MARVSSERILLIGDARQALGSALLDALPGADVTSVPTVFDGIAALSTAGAPSSVAAAALAAGGSNGRGRRNRSRDGRDANGRDRESRDAAPAGFTTVLAAADTIERRPEAAVRALRELAGASRLVLFGQPTLELLSRKMLQFGCDDYLVTPASGADLRQVLTAPNPRLAAPPSAVAIPASLATEGRSATGGSAAPGGHPAEGIVTSAGTVDPAVANALMLEALVSHPNNPVGWALRMVSDRLAPAIQVAYRQVGQGPPPESDGRDVLSHPVATPDGDGGTLYALFAADADELLVRDLLGALAGPIGKAAALATRHAALQRMAITDELTGVYNARYFRHFLQRILEKARQMHFPVTLLLFDIDDFKHYNDRYGHGVGDEILKQTAAMMKRSTREHDLVARIGGDEFAVVFWDKDGPRQPREPRQGNVSRPPHSPVQVFERFQRLIRSPDFTALGPTGQGQLGISAGLAVYPYEGHDVTSLIAAADDALMQGAKKQGGKNCLYIVGGNGNGHGNGTQANGSHVAGGQAGPAANG